MKGGFSLDSLADVGGELDAVCANGETVVSAGVDSDSAVATEDVGYTLLLGWCNVLNVSWITTVDFHCKVTFRIF